MLSNSWCYHYSKIQHSPETYIEYQDTPWQFLRALELLTISSDIFHWPVFNFLIVTHSIWIYWKTEPLSEICASASYWYMINTKRNLLCFTVTITEFKNHFAYGKMQFCLAWQIYLYVSLVLVISFSFLAS